MDEIIKQVSEKTGLSADQAKSAVDAVIGVLKTKLPAPIAGQIDSLLGGGTADAASGTLDAVKGALGGISLRLATPRTRAMRL